MQLQQHHFGGGGTPVQSSTSCSRSSSGSSSIVSSSGRSTGSSDHIIMHHPLDHPDHHLIQQQQQQQQPSTSTSTAAHTTRTLGPHHQQQQHHQSASSTPLRNNPNHQVPPPPTMYRLSSFIRPPNLGLASTSTSSNGLGGIGIGGQGESSSPVTTPMTEDNRTIESMTRASTSSFHRQNTSSSVATSPPSSVTTNVPTYETIDVGNLSHHHMSHGYNPIASTLDYCSSSGSAGSHSQTMGEGSGGPGSGGSGGDQSSTTPMIVAPDNQRLVMGGGGGGYCHGGMAPLIGQRPGYLSRHQAAVLRHYPHPTSDGSAYYSIYGNGGGGGGYQQNGNRSSESGIYSPTRRYRSNNNYRESGNCWNSCNETSHHHHRLHQDHQQDFDIANAIFVLISLTSYLVCVGACGALAYFLHRHEHDWRMAGMTLGAILVPAIIVNGLSLKWLLNDNHRQTRDPDYPVQRPTIGPCGWTLRILLHICLLGPALRYVDLLRYGVRSWSEKRKIEQRKENGTFWPSTTTTTSLPSLSTTLPRPRYLAGDGLPHFDTAQSKPTRKSQPEVDYYLLTVYEDRDSSLLALFRSLLQCTVQLVLQLYALLHYYQLEHHHRSSSSSNNNNNNNNNNSPYNHQFTEYVQLTVIGSCLFELAWSLASYHRSLRRASLGKRTMSPVGVALQFLWHLGTTGSRLLAVALFINQYGAWLAPITIGHWGVMTVWIMHQGTHFMMNDPHHLSEYLFSMLVGAIYLVQFLNVKDEPTRYKYSWYYALTGAENLVLVLLWAIRVSESEESELYWLRLPAIGAVGAMLGAGLLAMQLYYWCVHPSGRPLWVNKAARCC